MVNFRKILQQYWGYTTFRDLQEDIIRQVYEGNDVLALMPTGGGKSITFQVPTMAKDGLCIVITPLIALMKDQVENLKKRDIKALAIYSGMTPHEIDIAFDNATYGNYKFLYISPERLKTELFRIRVQKLKVILLAVDEAHCISQWGYDFRPSYLEIATIREWLPDIPILAITATATPKVATDIMEKLRFRKTNLMQKSFERKNLIYVVRKTNNKEEQLLKICQNVPGTGIIYVRSRRNAQEIAELLNKKGIKADFYHAGLNPHSRNLRQNEWMQNLTRVIVCTNAFGMGIDKPDVRFVVHTELPDSIEAYFQEAGRAGRDEKTAYAVLLHDDNDRTGMTARLTSSFPPPETIKEIYQKLYTFYNIPYGGGKGSTHDFNLARFATHQNLYSTTAHNSIQHLQREGYLEIINEHLHPTRIMILLTRNELYKIQVENEQLDSLIKLLLRTYTGLFHEYTPIDETTLAHHLHIDTNTLNEHLLKLSRMQVIGYIPKKNTPLILFNEERLDKKNINLSLQRYGMLKERYQQRMNAMLHYAESTAKCRNQQLLAYFGETHTHRCGRCDVCRKRNKLELSKYELDQLIDQLKKLIRENTPTIDECLQTIAGDPDTIINVLRWLIDNNRIRHTDNNHLQWITKNEQ
ncbi:MAG: RecQ family ATP-dependent DNA helicase [Prevotellaceae bacterium]|jgi:ATP-dependent DNA helicase RecQ|nr:RecQ family ATP-dependent DNA helicase [Prevotellaceae bacterium]